MTGRLIPLLLSGVILFLAGCAGQSFGANVPPTIPTSPATATVSAAIGTTVLTETAVPTVQATSEPTQVPSPENTATLTETGSGSYNSGGSTATVAPTIGLLPMPRNPIISTCAGTDDECKTRTCTTGTCGFSFTATGDSPTTRRWWAVLHGSTANR